MASKKLVKPKKQDEKNICPIDYKNEKPGPSVNCKLQGESSSSKMAAKKLDKPKKRDEKRNELICPIEYKNEMPGPAIDCKFMPCGKDILEYTEQPISFPHLEFAFLQNIGLQTLMGLDSLDLSAFDGPMDPEEEADLEAQAIRNKEQMDPETAALIADIDAAIARYSKRPDVGQEASPGASTSRGAKASGAGTSSSKKPEKK
ncbi:uncharacterized protein [Drosophila takahashii]|uniref:uncharacterized protein n=1 Tax=Drosophila takahashii TaxID=29030 RepID=UPI001CF9168F|nr:uncharacterized protein LOC108068115 [Drosophila takahashii]